MAMTAMDDNDSFTTVLRDMEGLSNKRDPRSIRLAAVTAALLEVVGADNVSPAQVYASCLQSLEQTLGSLQTQVALLEVLGKTVSHVSSAAIGATLSVSSRTLRAVVTTCREANEMETKDELGGVNATLRGVIRASSEIIKKLPPNAPEKAVKSFFHGTILSLFEDHRPKVRKAAHNATVELFVRDEPCHTAIIQSIQSYARSRLEKAAKHVNAENAHLLHLLAFLERVIADIDASILANVMELLVVTLQTEEASDGDFVANMSRKDVTHKILLVNGLLSCLVAYLEHETVDNEFAARVLASLIQAQPMTVFGSGSCDEDVVDAGKILYGRALLLSCQCVLSSDTTVGCKLFPLVIQMVLQLSRPSDEAPSVDVAQTLMVELTRTFRISLTPLVELQPQPAQVSQCLDTSLQGMEQVLHHSFRPTWSVTLQALSFLLHLMQDSDKVPAVVEAMIQLHSLVASTDASAREAVESAVSSLIQGVGIEKFWSWVSWKDPVSEAPTKVKKRSKKVEGVISTDRAWLLPLMRTSSMAVQPTRPPLGFFQRSILDLARQCDAFGANNPKAASFHRARVVDFWSLFPCFCKHPTDLEATFPTLSQTLIRAMGDARYPELVNIICGGLRTLATDVYEQRSEQGEPLDAEDDTDRSADQDAEVLAQASTKILPALFKLVETFQGTNTKSSDSMDVDEGKKAGNKNIAMDSQRSQSVIDTIAAFARLAPKLYLQSLFKKVMQRLLSASQSEERATEKICTLLGLSQALVTSRALDDASISLLYRAIKPLIRSDEHEARVQKRAYKVLFFICQSHSSFVTEQGRLDELIELLLDSIMTSQVSARHMRLKCMTLIVEGFEDGSAEHSAAIATIVPEVLLCLKDSNGKAREAAYQLLVAMAAVQDNKTEIFRIIAAALGAQTAHMRSAAVVAMSRLVFEYARAEDSVYELLPSLLQTVIVLFDEESREVIKSVVGFVRVSVAAMSPEQLEPLLPELVGGLLKYHRGKDRFRSKIKIIIKKLVRMYGYDSLMPLVPEGDTRLLTHMRKLSERAARRMAAQRQDGGPEKDDFDDLMESDEEDSDNGRTLMTGATGFTRMTGRTGKSIRSAAVEKSIAGRSHAASTAMSSKTRKIENRPRLRAEANGEVMDMLDPKMAKTVRFAGDEDFSDDSDSDGVMEFDEMGRLVVHDESEDFGANYSTTDGAELDEIAVPSKRQRLNKFESAKAARDEANKKKGKKKQVQSLGAAYKSKKAGGDVKKKGQKYEPYAFVPLDGKSYSKKNRRKTVEQMGTVVRQSGKRKR